jgi:hypothetical protein
MAVQRWGSQTIVNTTTAGDQFVPTVAALTDGGYVIAWQDGRSGDSDIRMQRFDAAGRKVGGELPVSRADDLGHNGAPSAIGLTNGGFLIGWSDQWTSPPTDIDIFVASYNPAGTRTGEHAPGATANDERQVSMTTNGTGAAIVFVDESVNDGDIFLQRVDANGDAVGSRIPVNTDVTADSQFSPDIAQLTNGNLAVVWSGGPFGAEQVRLALFTSSGTAFVINEVVVSSGEELNPSVTALANGNLVVTWELYRTGRRLRGTRAHF